MVAAKIFLAYMKDIFKSFKITPTLFGTMSTVGVSWHQSSKKISQIAVHYFFRNLVSNYFFFFANKHLLFFLKVFLYNYICLLLSAFMNISLKIWFFSTFKHGWISVIWKIWPYLVKSIASRIFTTMKKIGPMIFFSLIQSNWVKRIKKFDIFCKKIIL